MSFQERQRLEAAVDATQRLRRRARPAPLPAQDGTYDEEELRDQYRREERARSGVLKDET